MIIPDSAVEMNTGIGSTGEPGGAKAEANNFDIGYRTWLWDATFQALAKALELAVRYYPETYCLGSGGLAA
jgi:hypothetical protein